MCDGRPGVLKLRAFLFRADVIVQSLYDGQKYDGVLITGDSPRHLSKGSYKCLY